MQLARHGEGHDGQGPESLAADVHEEGLRQGQGQVHGHDLLGSEEASLSGSGEKLRVGFYFFFLGGGSIEEVSWVEALQALPLLF